ncbi:hypothetical protein BHL47_03930 [Bacillus cereus]|uniref:hypothetical protein n=1 Tax=Bacillus cereus TaxID=1396 RepID=UPI0009951A14|nr:hypothetical protein [Bacillus cereus]MCS6592583.1 hypothetical protein [Bacillus cereus]MDA2411261.1 hypothetical protein [Bacillus cereus]OPA32609.1 hypothetical protein BHL47_03930 [Bacillus cereus]
MFKKLSTIALGSALAMSLVACDDSSNKASTEKKDEPKQEVKKEAKQDQKQETKKDDKKKITVADVDTIKTGDPVTGEGGDKYEDLVAKYGEPDIKSDSTSKNVKTYTASWSKNAKGGTGANFTVSFIEKDGQKLAVSKTQIGME